MVPEARIVEGEDGLVPEGDGWYVLNARDARWRQRESLGRWAFLEAEPIPTLFKQVGFQLVVLEPGQPACMYHGEAGQEDFLVVAGECVLVVEEHERRLRQWDFVHCPPWTEHVFVGAGDGPCVVLMMGARGGERGLFYTRAAVAVRRGAAAAEETPSAREAYAPFGHWQPGRPAETGLE